MTNKKFNEKVVLITGAAVGIGRATSYEFFLEGAKVVVSDISESGEQIRDLIIKEGGESVFIKADVTKPQDHQNILETIIKHYGRLDYVCNNAGIEQVPQKLLDVEEGVWDRIMEVNLKAVWLGMKFQIPYLIKNGQGSIVNIASVAGLKAVEDIGVYNCSKAGVIMLTRTAALEYAKQNVRINYVAPGLVMTPMAERMAREHPDYFNEKLLNVIPMGRGSTPKEIAKAVIFLCSDDASFITGQGLTADGGLLA